MANYKETSVSGSSYVRSHRVQITNGLTDKGIVFYEEKITNLDGGELIQTGAGFVESAFSSENAGTQFKIINPATGTPVKEYDPDTGAEIEMTSTYQEVYTLLHSLYLHLALERDAAEAAAEEPVVEEPVVEEPVVE